MRKTLEGEEPPFRRVFLLPPNLPQPPRTSPKSTRLCRAKIWFALFWAGALGGSFLSVWEVEPFCKVRLRACLVGGALSLYCRERPMCRSASGESYLLTTVQCHTRVPRFRLPAPLRGSTPRQFFILSLDFRYLCRSAQNDTAGRFLRG